MSDKVKEQDKILYLIVVKEVWDRIVSGDKTIEYRDCGEYWDTRIKDKEYDFIYIDGYAHTGQEEGDTLEGWWPKLKQGGIFAGHDYDIKRWPLTVAAVDSFSTSVDKKINLTQENQDKSWYIIK